MCISWGLGKGIRGGLINGPPTCNLPVTVTVAATKLRCARRLHPLQACLFLLLLLLSRLDAVASQMVPLLILGSWHYSQPPTFLFSDPTEITGNLYRWRLHELTLENSWKRCGFFSFSPAHGWSPVVGLSLIGSCQCDAHPGSP